TSSGVVALRLSLMMSAYLLHADVEEKGLAGWINRTFEKVKNGYGRLLEKTFSARAAIYVSWVVIGGLALLMFQQSPKELAPLEDQGIIFGILNTPANSTIDQITPLTREIHKEMASIPETQFTFQITFPNGGFYGDGLKPWTDRKRNVFQVLPELSAKVAAIPGVQTFAVVPPSLPGGGNFPVEVILASTAEQSDILEFAQQLQQKAAQLSGVAMVPLNQGLRYLEDEAAKILPKGYTIDYPGESRQLRSEGNKFLPAFGLAVILIFLVLAAQFNSFRDPFVILAGSVPLAMFGALTMTFLKMPNPNMRFFTDGWTTTLNVYSQVGLVTLVGLVSKNGILIVEFANKLQESGQTKLEAIRNAAVTRLRPVLMTSVATVCGHFPLTLVTGPGAAARNSIGLVLVAGMAIGTAFTLFFVPAI